MISEIQVDVESSCAHSCPAVKWSSFSYAHDHRHVLWGTSFLQSGSTGLCRTWHQANARQTADEAAGGPFGIYVVFLCLIFAEAQKRASQHNTSLSETSLAEYRSLSVIRRGTTSSGGKASLSKVSMPTLSGNLRDLLKAGRR
jgi:hypothetical protein